MDNKDIMMNTRRIMQLHKWHITTRVKNLDSVHDAQQHLLFYVVNNPGCTQKEIADFFALSKAAVTKSVKRMLKSELIVRHVNDTDERKYALYATEKGEKMFKEFIHIIRDVDAMALQDFSDEQRKVFGECLEKMMNNLETDYSRGKNMNRLLAEAEEEKTETK